MNCFKNPPPPLIENNYLCWRLASWGLAFGIWPAQMLKITIG